MAAAAHFSTLVYGIIEGQVPYQDATGATAFSRVKDFPSPQALSFPTTGTVFTTLPNGFRMQNGAYVYSVIEVQATGLNVHGDKYVAKDSVATLATLAG